MVALILLMTGCTKKINLIEYVDMEMMGVDGQGIASPLLDEDKLLKDLAKAGRFNLEDAEDREILDDYISRVRYDVQPSKDIKNGDYLVLTAAFTNSNNDMIEILEGETHVKVDGLPEGEKIDIFDYVEYEVSGISPLVELEVINKGYDSFFKSIKFELSKSQGLAKGEMVEVLAKYDQYLAAEAGYYIERNQEVYQIDQVDEYVLYPGDIRMIIDQAQEKAKPLLDAFVKEEVLKGQGAYNSYLEEIPILTIKEAGKILEGNNANVLAFVYRIKTQSETLYAALYFNNLVKDKEGLIDMDQQEGNVAIWGKDREEILKFVVEDAKPLYNIEEIMFSSN